MRPKHIFLFLLLIPTDFIAFSQITRLLRQPSDVAVVFGVIFLALMVIGNFFIFRYLLVNLTRRP